MNRENDNQAGEVGRALADAAERFEAIRLTLIDHLDEPVRSAFWCAVEGKKRLAALATQPATSQERVLEDDYPQDFWQATTEDEREALFTALHRLKCNPSLDEIPLVMSEVAAILRKQPATSQEGEGTLANPGTFGKPTFGLDATPTPPAGADEVLRMAVAKLLPIGNDSLPGDRVIPIYVRMDELRALHALSSAQVQA